MQKITIHNRVVQETHHSFHCDDCGTELGISVEHDDGYYEEKGSFEMNLNIGEWYSVKKHLCPKCRQKFITKLGQTLESLGFKRK